ncbi:MAG TPA: CapA family protein [Spirochaetales bacterium]|nr:CapA family protein [Spirochaetales bacterium]HPE35948.1 CapA family protein [Spirochaetales bacterium]
MVSSCGQGLALDTQGMDPELADWLERGLFASTSEGGAGLRREREGARYTLAIADGNTRGTTAWLVGRTWQVPVADYLSGRVSVTLDECLDGSLALAEWDAIPDGMLGLAVDGLYPGDPGYPLVKETWLELRGDGNGVSLVADKLDAVLREMAVPTAPDLVWVAAVGDLMLERGVGRLLAHEGPQAVFGGAADMLAAADLAVANLEGALSARGTPENKAYTFRSDPAYAASLATAGFDALLVANNHAWDWGQVAFLDTLDHIRAAGMVPLGAGRNLAEAACPAEYVVGDRTVRLYGIASYPVETRGWDGSRVAAGADTPGIAWAASGGADAIKAAFSPEALDIVFFHGGGEWTTGPDRHTMERYRGLVDAGADAVVGSHPHVVHGMELRGGKPILWSVGNFAFAGMQGTPGGQDGLLALMGFAGGRLLFLRPHALRLDGPRVDRADDAALETFWLRSRALAGG